MTLFHFTPQAEGEHGKRDLKRILDKR